MLAFGVGVVGADLLDVVMVQGVVTGPLAAAPAVLARDDSVETGAALPDPQAAGGDA